MYKNAIVLGLGVSGQAAANLLIAEGTRVTVLDQHRDDNIATRAESLVQAGAEVLLGCDDVPEDEFDVCITSPGISCSSKWIRNLEKRGVEILSELELGWRHCHVPIIAITGSKGKSTMVKLCTEALLRSGRKALPAGNYGNPLCAIAMNKDSADWIVTEVSSFQLEKVKKFKPEIGVLLNVQSDHLDRHGSMKKYREIKARLFARMSEKDGDTAIMLDSDWSKMRKLLPGIKKCIRFGLSELADYRYNDGLIHWRDHKGDVKCSNVRGSLFENRIMGITAAGVAAVLSCCKVDEPDVVMERTVGEFKPLPHRMSKTACVGNVTFINDSKATNLAALAAALEMIGGKRTRLIAGGLLKEKNLEWLKEKLVKEVKCIYLIGDAAKRMEKEWKDTISCRLCFSLQDAVISAWKDAVPGDTVLLSPGCASFDQFKDFEDRGNQFEEIVRCINEERKYENSITC